VLKLSLKLPSLLPSVILRCGALPVNQKLSDGAAAVLRNATIKDRLRFGLELTICIHRWKGGKWDSGLVQFGFQARHMEHGVKPNIRG
jgi:hypothetical protein